MPLKRCNDSGKPGWKWGDRGKCYTYKKGDPSSEKRAKKKAIKQGIAIEPDKFKASDNLFIYLKDEEE